MREQQLHPKRIESLRGRHRLRNSLPVLVAFVWLGLASGRVQAQSESATEDLGGCKLKDHIYTCDGAAFQKALASAKTASVETHNVDGVARQQLTELLTKKLGKTIAAEDNPPDVVFLLVPVSEGGQVMYTTGDADLGTLRVYSATPDGARGHLLWAETFSGAPDMPWPAVVHGLILQFQLRFHIK